MFKSLGNLALTAAALIFLSTPARGTPADEPIDPRALSTMSGGLYYSLGLAPTSQRPWPMEEPAGVLPPPLGPGGFLPDNVQVSFPPLHDVEPAVISTTIDSSVYTVTVFARAASFYELWYSRRHDNSGSDSTGQMPTLLEYHSYGDPFLAGNLIGWGIAPGRIYNVGIMHNGRGAPNSAIGLWYSDNAGATWTGPVVVANEGTGGVFLDKPSVAVSSNWSSAGIVYVIYSRIAFDPVDFDLYVSRSTDGGAHFSTPTPLDSARDGGHQIFVEPMTGRVIALWVDYDAQEIRMSQSSDLGVTWSPRSLVARPRLPQGFIDGDTTHDGILYNTIPMGAFNSATGRLGLAWHEKSGGGSGSDVYYTFRETNGVWRVPVRANDVVANDQFMPSLAFDDAGKGLIAWYDRREDPTDTQFKLYGVTMDASGYNLSGNFPMSAFPSAATAYPQSFIGDYHQTISWEYPAGGHWLSSFVGNPLVGALQADVWNAYTH